MLHWSAMETQRLVIIGSGPAGYTAAIYAARADLQPLLFGGPEPGGQLQSTTEVDNFPGFPKGILGPELMDNMKAQAERFGTKIVSAAVTKVDFSTKPLKLWAGDDTYTTDAVIIATGATAKWLGLPNEQRLRGKGVSACATCDGFFFRGKDVAVVGGGDSAMEEATYLTKFAQHVTVIVRSDKLKASKAMIRRASQDPKITVRYNTTVTDVLGQDTVTGLKLKDVVSGQEEEFPVGGLFLAIGHQPNTKIFAGQLALVGPGYLQVIDSVKSSVPGVFIAGDVSDWRYRQAITAAGLGCMAALEAERYLAEQATSAARSPFMREG